MYTLPKITICLYAAESKLFAGQEGKLRETKRVKAISNPIILSLDSVVNCFLSLMGYLMGFNESVGSKGIVPDI